MSTPTVRAQRKIQEWGNGLAVQLPATLVRAARLTNGTSLVIEVVEEGVLLRASGKPKLTLAQKLKIFDPAIHRGEVGRALTRGRG